MIYITKVNNKEKLLVQDAPSLLNIYYIQVTHRSCT